MAHLTRRRLIEEPLKEARSPRSAVAEFVNGPAESPLDRIIVVALLVALDKYFRISGGFLQSRLVVGTVITLLFVGRLLLRRSPQKAQGNDVSKRNDPPEQDR